MGHGPYGQVMGSLWVGHWQVTGRLQVAYGQVTVDHGQVRGGLWILWAGHRQWGIIGNLKFKAYFELL